MLPISSSIDFPFDRTKIPERKAFGRPPARHGRGGRAYPAPVRTGRQPAHGLVRALPGGQASRCGPRLRTLHKLRHLPRLQSLSDGLPATGHQPHGGGGRQRHLRVRPDPLHRLRHLRRRLPLWHLEDAGQYLRRLIRPLSGTAASSDTPARRAPMRELRRAGPFRTSGAFIANAFPAYADKNVI